MTPSASAGPVATYDVIVIGGGAAGENAADYAIRGSDRTAALVESGLLGGECSYYACIPSKALLRPLDVAETAANLEGLSTPSLDRAGLLARRDRWVADYQDAGQVRWATGAGLDVVRGHGRLVGDRTVEVFGRSGDVRHLVAREAVVLATGSVPVIPPPLAGVAPWTTREATGVTAVPDRLAIVGGGPAACEAARWMSALGAEVTLLVRHRLLSRFEDFAGDDVADGLRAAGVRVLLDTAVDSAERATDPAAPAGALTLHLDDGADLTVDEVLVAAGRRPNTDDLGLDALDLTAADLQGRTHGGTLPDWLYTVGDVNGEALLTHWGKHQARMVGRRIAARAEGRPAPEELPAPVPTVVFTSPQVAAVGLTSREAAAHGLAVRLLDVDYTSAAGASLLRDDAHGQVRLVVDAATDVLLGATFVGPEVAEQLHAATIAITAGLDLATLRRAVPSYPTASEVWLRLLEQ
ncbi:NAD(P)/FAD-dependent oxidoreductase [Raineyella sp.]|uniref:dihydrolipoyl dehydrogenase family protein n=1 Tax=Raineyella sp. TaxID=1911550 RepID=UPI002B1F29A1|nr:NAD(P)/FAD-dependent oxidoreductase [Raineyella sp.]MEA5155325.1 NAD(P)/FAD-dependent oxidoreductase [Raineyella sp.]